MKISVNDIYAVKFNKKWFKKFSYTLVLGQVEDRRKMPFDTTSAINKYNLDKYKDKIYLILIIINDHIILLEINFDLYTNKKLVYYQS